MIGWSWKLLYLWRAKVFVQDSSVLQGYGWDWRSRIDRCGPPARCRCCTIHSSVWCEGRKPLKTSTESAWAPLHRIHQVLERWEIMVSVFTTWSCFPGRKWELLGPFERRCPNCASLESLNWYTIEHTMHLQCYQSGRRIVVHYK